MLLIGVPMDKYTNEYLFLNEVCNKILACDFESSIVFFHLPCVVVNNDREYIFKTEPELKTWLSSFCKKLEPESSEELTFTLRKTVAMSPTITFSQVSLEGLRLLKEKKQFDVSFTLSSDVDGTLKIIVVVLDDI